MQKEKYILFDNISESDTWDVWLEKTETALKENGYKRQVTNYKSEDFCYWKTVVKGKIKIYQQGVCFYDWRKYPHGEGLGISLECLLISDNRIDMSASGNMKLKDFELMCEKFYKTFKNMK